METLSAMYPTHILHSKYLTYKEWKLDITIEPNLFSQRHKYRKYLTYKEWKRISTLFAFFKHLDMRSKCFTYKEWKLVLSNAAYPNRYATS